MTDENTDNNPNIRRLAAMREELQWLEVKERFNLWDTSDIPEASDAARIAMDWIEDKESLLAGVSRGLHELKAEFEQYDDVSTHFLAKLCRACRLTELPPYQYPVARLREILEKIAVSLQPLQQDQFSEACGLLEQELQFLADWVEFCQTKPQPATTNVTQRATMERLLRLTINETQRLVSRWVPGYGESSARLSGVIWELFVLLLEAGETGTTAEALMQSLNIDSMGTLSQRKHELNGALITLDLAVPRGRYRLEHRDRRDS